MKIRLDTAKNASVTCVVDGRFLHSKYNPENEAKAFVDSIACNFEPSCIFLLGASLPFCASHLQKRFPNKPIFAIQYNNFFILNHYEYGQHFNTDSSWTKTFLCDESTTDSTLCEEIFNTLGEITLAAPLVLEWKAAHVSFPSESSKAWQSMRLLISKTSSILSTRSYFSDRWLKNIIKFCIYTKKIKYIDKISYPILLIASGASLKYQLANIKKAQNNFFILALSSSLSVLFENGIIPDLCISTDGGYYAQKHLDVIRRNNNGNKSIPIAVSPESNIPVELLETIPVLPLTYNDGIENVLLNACSIQGVAAQRNGTVSGTAAELALAITDSFVYAVGLDLSTSKGYSHAQPNEHEKIHEVSDFRLSPLSSRLSRGRHAYTSNTISPMEIYKQWFSTRGEVFSKRFFRILPDGFQYENSLGIIKDIPWTDVLSVHTSKKEHSFYKDSEICDTTERIEKVKSIIKKEKKETSAVWLEHCAISELIMARKYPFAQEYQCKLAEKIEKCFASIEGFCT